MSNVIKLSTVSKIVLKHEVQTMSKEYDEREDLQKLIQDIKDDTEYGEDYYSNNPDSCSDFLESFCYGDADEDEVIKSVMEALDDELDELVIDKLEAYLKGLDAQYLFDKLSTYVSMESYHGFHNVTGSILSHRLGEIEWQVRDELIEQLNELSEAERKYIENETCLRGDYVYVCSEYDSWHLILNTDSLIKDLKITISIV